MIFRQFCTVDKEISYLLADPVTLQAALVDPNLLAIDEYLAVAQAMNLNLLYVMETHAHESHRSASSSLRLQLDAKLIAHDRAQMLCTDIEITGDDCIYLGEEQIHVFATPGHSRCSLCYHWRDRVFTGHTLLAGISGSCQRMDSDAADMLTSIRSRLLCLPGETLVYPGRVNAGRCLSSIAQEQHDNLGLTESMTMENFIEHKRLEALNGKPWPEKYITANQQCNY